MFSKFHPFLSFLAFATILSTVGSLASAETEAPPIAVEKTIVLYDGKTVNDLTKFYTWLGPLEYQDPNRVFTVVEQIDGAPAIRISGEDWGGIETREQYSRFKLVAEFRWGAVTSGKRKAMARNSGVLIHCQGDDGNFKSTFDSPWLTSIEYEILEGRMGDAILVPGYLNKGDTERIFPRATMRALPGDFHWNPEGDLREFPVGGKSKLHWFGEDPDWKEVLGFRGRNDVDKPLGEWNLVEAIVDGGNLTYFFNGVKVMEVTNCSLTYGRLLFQSEGAEIYFRRIELHPLDD